MEIQKHYKIAIQLLVFLLFVFLVFANTPVIYVIIYALTAALLLIHTLFSKFKLKIKFIFSGIYILILVLQQIYINNAVFLNDDLWLVTLIKKIIGIIAIFLPYFIRYIHYLYRLEHQFNISENSNITFDMLTVINRRKNDFRNNLNKGKVVLSKDNITEIAQDIPRHSYFKYLSKGSLSETYFEECEKSLSDENIYIVLSSTGSSASELISLFTKKAYNHVSLSFDKDLRTTISYNGGENVTLPGLNQEQLNSFHKKDDASIMVYKINAPVENKKRIIEKIKEINETGSAYNLVGLITKVSIRPNIMFCSQFIYSILQVGGLAYFKSVNTKVKPTDFVENDYYRKLEFCYEINFKDI
ncbi:hypothetical protein MHZ36_00725 [Staphylococcus sp. ACRSN]|uniref:hypothetical protein n=1 Tax=Staphylococcus sp. ACRSN TaxID=2918214 RepID=UPI001EF36451|nr:hypothetical protein [Staphylococcus sp. ACRSN]MCG7337801.1 hypothetical protein [Staphylococcus sp. ACRSN]